MTHVLRAELDGRPADATLAGILASGGYGHFTAMQVRDGATRGLDRHLARLDGANRELFGQPLDPDLVRGHVRRALAGIDAASVRVQVFGEPDGGGVSVLVSVRPPAPAPAGPQRLRTVAYQRPVAHLKHSGGFAQGYWRRVAEREGFDEALLTDADGVISEGAITNLGCWDGTGVVWPDAPALDGITMQVLIAELAGHGVPSTRRRLCVSDLGGYPAVFITNSHGVAAVAGVDELVLPQAPDAVELLVSTYEKAPWQAI